MESAGFSKSEPDSGAYITIPKYGNWLPKSMVECSILTAVLER